MSPEMAKFLNEDRIALLPPNAIVVNSARGGLVDDEALIDLLTERMQECIAQAEISRAG